MLSRSPPAAQRLTLGRCKEFLIDWLAPDGVVLQVECTWDWPCTGG